MERTFFYALGRVGGITDISDEFYQQCYVSGDMDLARLLLQHGLAAPRFPELNFIPCHPYDPPQDLGVACGNTSRRAAFDLRDRHDICLELEELPPAATRAGTAEYGKFGRARYKPCRSAMAARIIAISDDGRMMVIAVPSAEWGTQTYV